LAKIEAPGESWTWGIILPVLYCSAQSAAAVFGGWSITQYCIITVGMVIMYCACKKWIDVRDLSLAIVLLMTLSLYFVQIVQFNWLTHSFSQPSPSCARAVVHSQGFVQNRTSTIGTLSHSYGWACHFNSAIEHLHCH